MDRICFNHFNLLSNLKFMDNKSPYFIYKITTSKLGMLLFRLLTVSYVRDKDLVTLKFFTNTNHWRLRHWNVLLSLI